MPGPAFIDKEVFVDLLSTVSTADGSAYKDVDTIYGDMSRLVVAWLASQSPAQLNRLYHQLGWGGSANGRAIHAAASEWIRRHRARPTQAE